MRRTNHSLAKALPIGQCHPQKADQTEDVGWNVG